MSEITDLSASQLLLLYRDRVFGFKPMTPTLPVVAFPVGLNRPQLYINHPQGDWSPFTYPFNLTQQPAASVPCGFTKNGLPVGVQIVAAKYRDLLVLQAAKAYENVSPFITLAQTAKY